MATPSTPNVRRRPLAGLGPGILVAATGVGAGDLLTSSLAGSRLGLTILWAAWVGALLKWFLNEGIARWQMATGTTLLGVLGGVGGTVTLLSYGYWVREEVVPVRRDGEPAGLDLAVGYTMTAAFGVAMIVIGSRVDLQRGPTVALQLAGQLEGVLGPAGRWVFLAGFWAAVFSSLLGVWQSVPYLFADFVRLRPGAPAAAPRPRNLARTTAYRGYLAAIALVPLPLLWLSLERAQLTYAVLGSFFMPFLALTLLLMNNRVGWVGTLFRNGRVANLAFGATLLLFVWVALRKLVAMLV